MKWKKAVEILFHVVKINLYSHNSHNWGVLTSLPLVMIALLWIKKWFLELQPQITPFFGPNFTYLRPKQCVKCQKAVEILFYVVKTNLCSHNSHNWGVLISLWRVMIALPWIKKWFLELQPQIRPFFGPNFTYLRPKQCVKCQKAVGILFYVVKTNLSRHKSHNWGVLVAFWWILKLLLKLQPQTRPFLAP